MRWLLNPNRDWEIFSRSSDMAVKVVRKISRMKSNLGEGEL